jgi:thiamine pyrophosphokinase
LIFRDPQKNQTALIIANGELPATSLLREAAGSSSLVICVDGAANQLFKGSPDLIPSVVLGDLDSITAEVMEFYSNRSSVVQEVDQDKTDLDKAILFATSRDIKQIIVVGVKGSRVDHAISNIHVLHKYADSFAIAILDDDGYGFFLNPGTSVQSVKLDEPVGTPVSLIPFGQVNGITTEGLRYPLLDESLIWAGRSGQSNQISERPASITLAPSLTHSKGCGLLVFVVTKTDLDPSH